MKLNQQTVSWLQVAPLTVVLLVFFGIPMLMVGYSSQLLQNKIKGLLKHEAILRYVSGGILVIFGLYSIFAGNMAF